MTAAQSADDALSDGLANPKRVTDGQHDIAHRHPRRQRGGIEAAAHENGNAPRPQAVGYRALEELASHIENTPLGVVETDRAAVDALARDLGEAEALGSEPFHDGEHSVELAAVWAASLLDGGRRPAMTSTWPGSSTFSGRQGRPAAPHKPKPQLQRISSRLRPSWSRPFLPIV